MVGRPLRTSGQNREAKLANVAARLRDFIYISRGNVEAQTPLSPDQEAQTQLAILLLQQ